MKREIPAGTNLTNFGTKEESGIFNVYAESKSGIFHDSKITLQAFPSNLYTAPDPYSDQFFAGANRIVTRVRIFANDQKVCMLGAMLTGHLAEPMAFLLLKDKNREWVELTNGAKILNGTLVKVVNRFTSAGESRVMIIQGEQKFDVIDVDRGLIVDPRDAEVWVLSKTAEQYEALCKFKIRPINFPPAKYYGDHE
jgi:hypothetical protein